MGEVHGRVLVTAAVELSEELLSQRLLAFFGVDSQSTHSLEKRRQDYTREVEKSRQEVHSFTLAEERKNATHALRAQMRQGCVSVSKVLRAISAKHGEFNWILLEPSRLDLHAAGIGGLEEMKKNLTSDKVLFGLLRLSFEFNTANGTMTKGAGITKYIFIHWEGPDVTAVRRGILNEKLKHAAQLMSKVCALRREAHSPEDLDLETIVSELKRLTELDGVVGISAASYRESLEREVRRKQAHTAHMLQKRTKIHNLDVRNAVEIVRDASGEYDWVILGWSKSSESSQYGSRSPLRSVLQTPERA